jgi:putative transposase
LLSKIKVSKPFIDAEVAMAQDKSTTLEEALQVILDAGGENPFKDMLQFMVQRTLEHEMTEHLGAKPYERTGDRRGHRNGYKPRTLITRVGTLNLLVPQDRDGNFSTSLFDRYQRSEKALVAAIMQMYVQGVSTRNVARVTEELCGRSFSGQLVSKLAKELDYELVAWRERRLDGEYPYLIVDARYEKVRDNHKVVSQAVLIISGINTDGFREILSVSVAETENDTSWSNLFKDLKRRGVKGVLLVISDDHKGIKAAASRHFQGAAWQRCQCHFSKNMMDIAPKAAKSTLKAELHAIYDAADIEMARRLLDQTIARWEDIRPQVAVKLDEEAEDILSCFYFPQEHRRRIRTTNSLERVNQEIKRRTRVVRIFPNREACLSLASALCMEQSEEWLTGRRYLDREPLKELEAQTELAIAL